jgi:Ca2+-transporting ATPase
MSVREHDPAVADDGNAARRPRQPAAPGSVPLSSAPARPAGLSAGEARKRLARDGANELPQSQRRNVVRIFVDVMREPMLLLLATAAVLYMILGDLAEALVLCASVVVVVALTLYQENKSERALQALRDLASPRAAVLRDGALTRIAAREVVVGDLVMVSEGDRVPADACVLSDHDLLVDESILTGESVPVAKRAAPAGTIPRTLPGSVGSPQIYSSTLVVAGHAIAEVTAVGIRTEVGRIGRALEGIAAERSPLQAEISHAVIVFAAIGLGLCALVTALYVALRGGWIDALLAGVTLAIANIPEELPVILSVFLAIGAWRLARHHVLTRRASAIETLGAITVLCTDKTGTLTENRMAVAVLWTGGNRWTATAGAHAPMPDRFHDLVRYAVLASETSPFDPMEKAILSLAGESQPDTLDAHGTWRLVKEYPLSQEILAHTHVWQAPLHERFVVACKGAPESIAALCELGPNERASLLAETAVLAGDALRVIAVAAAEYTMQPHGDAGLPVSAAGFGFRLLGLVGLADPLRAGVRAAVHDATAAGVRTIILTGDFPATAAAIARAAGFTDVQAKVIRGEEVDALDDKALSTVAATGSVFARVRPEQKLRLVQALKANGDIVAMTGDGVNDAIALKAAHVGVAMGARGSDVAREAAAIVLLDDNFVSIVHAIRLGRTIYDNIERALRFVLAVHVPIAGIALLPLLVGGPLVLWPVHIVFLELVIDPACSIVFERESAEANVMRRPPRDARRRLLGMREVSSSLLTGGLALAAVACAYLAAWLWSLPAQQVSALTFASIVAANLGLIAINRTGGMLPRRTRPANRALRWVMGLAIATLGASLYVPAIERLFRFESPPVLLVAAAAGLPLLALALLDVWLQARRRARGHESTAPGGALASR